MTAETSGTPANAAEIEAARLLLARMGVEPADLLATAPSSPQRPMPTISEWIDTVATLVTDGTARPYGSYWKKARAAWGDRRLDEISASEIRAEAERAKATAVVRRNSRGGRNAAENFVAAIRCLYRHAEEFTKIRSIRLADRRPPRSFHGARVATVTRAPNILCLTA